MDLSIITAWLAENKALAIAALAGVYIAKQNAPAIWSKVKSVVPSIGTGSSSPDANDIAAAYRLLEPLLFADTRAKVIQEIAEGMLAADVHEIKSEEMMRIASAPKPEVTP